MSDAFEIMFVRIIKGLFCVGKYMTKKVKNHQTIGRSGGFTITLKLSFKREK